MSWVASTSVPSSLVRVTFSLYEPAWSSVRLDAVNDADVSLNVWLVIPDSDPGPLVFSITKDSCKSSPSRSRDRVKDADTDAVLLDASLMSSFVVGMPTCVKVTVQSEGDGYSLPS